MKRIRNKWWYLLKNTCKEFVNDNTINLSASLSYYAIFSLPPLLIIIISVSDLFLSHHAVKGEIYGQINSLVGSNISMEIGRMLKNIRLNNNGIIASITGGIILVIVASGIFSEIQDSIDYIWGIKAKPKQGIAIFLKRRLMSFCMIGFVGFLLMLGLIINTVTDLIYNQLLGAFPIITVDIFYILNLLIVFLIVTILFTIIFKTLQGGIISIKDSLRGALFSSFLFILGKFVIGAYLSSTHIASIYGAAGSVIVLLIWVYYSSMILYLGAEFIKVYANMHGRKMVPDECSIHSLKGK